MGYDSQTIKTVRGPLSDYYSDPVSDGLCAFGIRDNGLTHYLASDVLARFTREDNHRLGDVTDRRGMTVVHALALQATLDEGEFSSLPIPVPSWVYEFLGGRCLFFQGLFPDNAHRFFPGMEPGCCDIFGRESFRLAAQLLPDGEIEKLPLLMEIHTRYPNVVGALGYVRRWMQGLESP